MLVRLKKLEHIEKAYWNHEVSKMLNVGESSLRKWCIALEKNGYNFIKGHKQSRAFTDHDIKALMYFRDLTRLQNYKIEQAAEIVAKKFAQREFPSENGRTTPIQEEHTHSLKEMENMMKKLIEHTEKQEEFNLALLKRLEEQERYIKQSIEKRDQLLLESLRESQEKHKKQSMIERIKSIFRT
jgi:transposase